ncbi:MAG: hypothetical protein CMP23_11765 [Rickettsiales bacterium]|nr:hypothetical protein [Rickettsiales bacterium]
MSSSVAAHRYAGAAVSVSAVFLSVLLALVGLGCSDGAEHAKGRLAGLTHEVALSAVGEGQPGADAGLLVGRVSSAAQAVAGAVVWLKDGSVGEPAPLTIELRAEQGGFQPSLQVAPVGSRLVVDHQGDQLQTFHLRLRDGQGGLQNLQNLVVPPGHGPAFWRLSEPGVIEVGSDARPEQRGWIYVYGTGSARITGPDGSFEFSGLAAGRYSLSFWHPQLGAAERSVEVPAAGPANLYVSLPPR